jgi:hypothetical protein
VVTLTAAQREFIEHARGAARAGLQRNGISRCNHCAAFFIVTSTPDGHGGAALGARCEPCRREIRVMIDAPAVPPPAP